MEQQIMTKHRELEVHQLRNRCDPSLFDFDTTADIKIEDAVIDQERAMKAISFGLNIKSMGYNIYAAGVTGTGRSTTIRREVLKTASTEKVPDDICYINNFDKPEEPKVLKLPAGMGCGFHDDLEGLIKELSAELPRAFSGKDYEEKKKEVVDRSKDRSRDLTGELEEHAREMGFTIQQTLTGLSVVPLRDGRAMNDKDFAKLSKDDKKTIEQKQKEVYDRIFSYTNDIKRLHKEAKKNVKELDKDIAVYISGQLIEELKTKYAGYDAIIRHLDRIIGDIQENLDLFKKPAEGESPFPFMQPQGRKEDILQKYSVNLLVEHCSDSGAPVITEDNPSYHNLIGKVEHRAQMGMLTTDFTMIKPGAVHRASGGYLILQVRDILRDYWAWDALKKIIINREVKIESLGERFGLVATASLKPEPVAVDIKVILIGNPMFYQLLYIYDEEFRKLFKVKADFDSEMKRDDEVQHKLAGFVSVKARQENLMPFSREAVAEITDYASRETGHKEKITARFMKIDDIIRESEFWARKEEVSTVEGEHVRKALEEKLYRSGLFVDKLQDMIRENTLMIDTEGETVGQINGLSVMFLGDLMFGRPSRITARTYLGKGKVIDIEREAEMSGHIHSKGVMILSGYFGYKFGQDKPLAFSASIAFEQSYSGVDGDSASSTELYCLLSSLSGLPLRQDIAVTGSVNQHGQIQPVGGINQKIEGFFEVCRMKGLTGEQGIVMPFENVKNLMLKEDVIEAVRDGSFHIYPVSTIDEGISILTGTEAGEMQDEGDYPENTVNRLVNDRLLAYAETLRNFSKSS